VKVCDQIKHKRFERFVCLGCVASMGYALDADDELNVLNKKTSPLPGEYSVWYC
jgi:hypothetical protein